MAQHVAHALEGRSAQLVAFTYGLSAVLLGLLGFLAWRLWSVVRAILSPMQMLATRSASMAAGDLSQSFRADTRTRVGLTT